MIAYIKGQLLHIETPHAVILTQGVGYQVYLLKNDLDFLKSGEEIELFIHTQVKEDAIDLYGFFKNEEKQAFQMLISINGIGPKIAMGILSSLNLKSLIDALAEKNIALLCQIPGIGKKTAERMALELKDKVLKLKTNAPNLGYVDFGARENLILAIKNLGFSKEQSDRALIQIATDDLKELSFDALIKKALNIITTGSNYDDNSR